MKKKILFVTNDLQCDGASKSLLSLLEHIDYEKYEVDLFLFAHKGMFMEMIPEQVNVLPLSSPLKELTMPVKNSVKNLIYKGYWKLSYRRIKYLINYKLGMTLASAMQSVWPYYVNQIDELEKDYDVAISYQDLWAKYFIVEKTKANIKIAWNHCNLSKLGMDVSFEKKYNKDIDYWITISEECKKVLDNMFAEMSDKTVVIENIISPSIIREMSTGKAMLDNETGQSCIVTVGRLSYEKGIDLALESCGKLVEEGYNIRWYVVGEGQERGNLEKIIKDKNLQENFMLIGLSPNPYPFIKDADIYVQPSRTEGKSIAIEEAKALGKPLVVTNYETVASQVIENKTGLIASIDSDGLVTRIKELLGNPLLAKELSDNLKNYKGNEKEINKLYNLMEEK